MRAALKSRVATWIALGAVLFAAASPLLAALRFHGSPEVLAQICTFSGIKAASPEPAVPSPDTPVRLKHCVFCLVGAWDFPAADASSAGAPAGPAIATAAARAEFPSIDFAALQPLSPRAPPRA